MRRAVTFFIAFLVAMGLIAAGATAANARVHDDGLSSAAVVVQ